VLTVTDLDELRARAGDEIGVSDWHDVTQDAIDEFARVTGDHQWIHVDPVRATRTPFGGTIAHGYYTLSLHPLLSAQLIAYEGFAFAVNYGLNRVRFPAPLPVGNRVRMRMALVDVEDVLGGAQITTKLTFEGEGALKPVCVAESLTRVYTG
jgi:acyl dehydratase